MNAYACHRRRPGQVQYGHGHDDGDASESESSNLANYNNRTCAKFNLKDDALKGMIRFLVCDEKFIEHYYTASLVPIRYTQYCYTFRAVTRAEEVRSGVGAADHKVKDLIYPESLMSYLMGTDTEEKHPTRSNLLDSYRDKDCLDLVAIKIETLSDGAKSATEPLLRRIRLIREFHLLGRLYRTKKDHLFLPVGFQLPINFEFVGSTALSSSPGSSVVLSPQGEATIYEKAFIDDSPEGAKIQQICSNGITDTCYLTLEMVGPSISEYKDFFDKAVNFNTGAKKVEPVLNVQTILKLMDQVLCRLIVLHRKNIVHLDLRPENVCTGVGRVSNVIYLVNLELAVECSGFPTFREAGDPAFASVAVDDGNSPNYMMDVESSFYLLLYLLGGRLPWSEFAKLIGTASRKAELKHRRLLNGRKRQLWRKQDSEGLRHLLQEIQERHGLEYPAIGQLLADIHAHLAAMREDFLLKDFRYMRSKMQNESSHLFEAYRKLRLLLLCPFRNSIVGRSKFFGHRSGIEFQELERRYSKAERRSTKRMGPQSNDGLFFFDGISWDWGWDIEYKRLDKVRNLEIMQKTDEQEEKVMEHLRQLAAVLEPR